MAQALNKFSSRILITLLLVTGANIAIARQNEIFDFMNQTIIFQKQNYSKKISEEIVLNIKWITKYDDKIVHIDALNL